MAGKKRKNRSSLHLTDKRHPKTAIVSVILAVLSVLVFFGACAFSSTSKGNASLSIGFVGLLSVCLAIAGFVLGFISLHKSDIRHIVPSVAALVNGLIIIFYMILYIWGTFL